MTGRGRDWSRLPPELLEEIAGHLPEIPDLFRFRSVCSSWRSASASKSITLSLKAPWIHLKGEIKEGRSEIKRRFFSVSENRIYTLPHPSPIYDNNEWMFASSCCGCGGGGGQVISYTVDSDSGTVRLSLLNPITRCSTPLPPLLRVSHCAPIKIKLFVPDLLATMYLTLPYFVLAIFFCRPGEPAWQKIDGEPAWQNIDRLYRNFPGNFAYHDGCFYVHDSLVATSVFDMRTLQKVSDIPFPWVMRLPLFEHYLVESSSGKLLLVLIMNPTNCQKSRFELFQLVASEQQMKWTALSSIGNDVLFVDVSQAMCFDASDFKGCRRDCIYFLGYLATADPWLKTYGVQLFDERGDRRRSTTYGVHLFDVREGQVEKVLSFDLDNSHSCLLSSWFVPSL